MAVEVISLNEVAVKPLFLNSVAAVSRISARPAIGAVFALIEF
ncbi:MAG: hypothetical protein ACI9ZF_002653 [Bradyrhizobium sp.]|jgi:hypothetical protein